MQADSLKTLVTDLLQKMDIVVEEISVSSSPRVVISVLTPESSLLIGPQGEHLRAFTALARRIAETRHGAEAASFLVDVNGFYEKQLEQIRTNARMLAQRARLFKYDVEMSPMSSYERLIIHELFAEDPEIETHSEGIGKFRHIVLKYRQKNPPSTA